MNIKGSGQGDSKACRFQQRIAIAPESDMSHVYQLALAATSIFGEAKDGNMPMQAYAKFLKAHNTPAVAIVTQMRFDENSDVPKLFFKPVRPLTEEELTRVVDLRDTEECKQAVTLTVAQTDGIQKIESKPAVKAEEPEVEEEEAPKPKPKRKKPAPKPAKEAEEDDAPVEEPVKKSTQSRKKEVVEEDSDLASILDEWDD
jgi:outer membrane biosynthesis protein TonB